MRINVTGVTTLLPIAPTLEELNSNKSNVLRIEPYGYKVTVSAGAVLQQSHDVSLEGYVPIGVVGFAP